MDNLIDNCGHNFGAGVTDADGNWCEWTEITERLYWYFLEVLPPIYGHHSPRITDYTMFAVSEPLRHLEDTGEPVYTICRVNGGRYYATEGTLRAMNSGMLAA